MAGAPSPGDSHWECVGVHSIYFFHLVSRDGAWWGIYLGRRCGLQLSPKEEKGRSFRVSFGGWGLKEVGSGEGWGHLVSEMDKADC